nr:MAG TPA: hypothetical protein [Caudoviricetes sp.]
MVTFEALSSYPGPDRGPTNFIIQRKSNILHLKPLKIIDLQ